MASKPRDGRTAWVVERNDSNRRLLAELLEDEGLEVTPFARLDEVSERLEDGPTPTLAVVDIDGFPHEVWEVCQQVVGQGVPVVVMTQSRTSETQDETLSLGVRAVLEKPLRKANLRAIARSLAGDDEAAERDEPSSEAPDAG